MSEPREVEQSGASSSSKPNVEQPSGSSSSKPEYTRLTVEEAKEVFTKGRGRPLSELTITDEELKVFYLKIIVAKVKIHY